MRCKDWLSEDALGTRLFNRTAGGLTLTYAGEKYYQMAAQILKMYDDFETEVSDINNLKTGRIHLGITNHLGTLVLPRILPAFHSVYPNVEVYVSEENSSTLDQKILSGELDFAITHAPSKDENQPLINYELLEEDPFLIAMSPDHPLVGLAEKSPDFPYPVLDVRRLKDEPFICLPQGYAFRTFTDSICEKAGFLPHVVTECYHCQMLDLISAGLGVEAFHGHVGGEARGLADFLREAAEGIPLWKADEGLVL